MKKVFFLTGLLSLLLACSKDRITSNNQDNATVTHSNGKNAVPFQNTVHILNSGFSPDSLTANVNSTVAWINDDNATHTVTSDKFDSGDLPPGGVFSFAFDNTGSYYYHCKYHSESAVIVVAGIR